MVPRHKGTGTIAIGATVTAQVGSLKMVCPIIGVNGYLVSNDPRAHFGLGAATQADWVEVLWPDGSKQKLENVPADQILEVTCPGK